jgi:hypothetical protein
MHIWQLWVYAVREMYFMAFSCIRRSFTRSYLYFCQFYTSWYKLNKALSGQERTNIRMDMVRLIIMKPENM